MVIKHSSMPGKASITPPGQSAAGTTTSSETSRRALGGPIVVLSYAHADAALLTRMLAASPAVACTQNTGLLPLCQAAAATWQSAEGRGALSALAIKSIRALVGTMATVVQSRSGATRWCETAYAGPATATTFLRIFPNATFLCLHRSLQAVLAAGIATYPWGLADSPFWPFSDSQPGNNIAAIAAYWAAYAESLLDFEDMHPESCLRVRHEDLTSNPRQQASKIFTRLALDACDLTEPAQLKEGQHLAGDAGRLTGPDGTDEPQLPMARIPPHLLAKAGKLHLRLGYAPLRP
jgi:hypothetical protein